MRAIVTGAARGLGAGVAARLARDGGAVACLDLLPAVADTAARIARETGAPTHAAILDVADAAAVDAAVDEAVEALGGLDLLVACAGIGGPDGPAVDTDPADVRRTLDVNVLGTFSCARAAARHMLAQGTGGAIVVTGSLFGQQAVANGAAYNASKGATTLLMQTLALELGPSGIRVNSVAPGLMDTEMHWDALRAEAERRGIAFEQQVAEARATVPLGRHGTAEDMAGVVAWLASDDAAYVAGQTIAVNGGVFLT